MSLPSVPQVKKLSAHLNTTLPDVAVILLKDDSSEYSGLTSSFSINAQATQKQTLGLVRADTPLHFSGEVILKNGARIECRSGQRGALFFSMSDSRQHIFDCQGQTLSLSIETEILSANEFSAHSVNQSLSAGASLILTHVDDTEHMLELTLQEQTLTLAERGPSVHTTSKSIFSTNEIQAFLTAQTPLTIQCPTTLCAETSGPLTLTLKVDGEIVATRKRSAQTSSSKNLTQDVFRRSGSEGLRVATYNVENFWDDDAANSKPYDDFSSDLSDWYTGKFSHLKARRIREALLAAGLPDVVGLQEIESAANGSRSLEILKPVLAPLGYTYYALGQQASDNPTAVTTAFISKYPILENTRIDFLFESKQLTDENRNDFVGASRDPQRVTVGLPEGVGLMLLNSHWKSKRDKSPLGDTMRSQIGQLMRTHLSELARIQGQPVTAIIMGDFNADYRESSVQQGLQLAPTLAQARRSADSLFNLWQTKDASQQGDYPHDSALTAIDNLVVTQPLLSASPLVLSQSLRVVGDFGTAAKRLRNGDHLPFRSQRHQIKESDGRLRTFHKDMGYSDHLPLVVELGRSLSPTRMAQAFQFTSTIEEQHGPHLAMNKVNSAACETHETKPLTMPELSSALMSAERGDCFEISAPLSLRKTGLYNIAFDLPVESQLSASQRIIIVSADRPYGENKSWLRQTLQQSEGKTLLRLRGRLGIIDGVKALFVSDPTNDVLFAESK